MIEVKGFVVMFLFTFNFVVRGLVTIKNMQGARSIKKQEQSREAEISLLTNKIFSQKICYLPIHQLKIRSKNVLLTYPIKNETNHL